MITVGMNYEVREGKQEAFERKFELVVDALRALPGHMATSLYRNVGTGRSYLVVSEWRDRASFDAFISSEAFRRTTSWGTSAILEGRPSHRVYGDEQPASGRCPFHAGAAAQEGTLHAPR